MNKKTSRKKYKEYSISKVLNFFNKSNDINKAFKLYYHEMHFISPHHIVSYLPNNSDKLFSAKEILTSIKTFCDNKFVRNENNKTKFQEYFKSIDYNEIDKKLNPLSYEFIEGSFSSSLSKVLKSEDDKIEKQFQKLESKFHFFNRKSLNRGAFIRFCKEQNLKNDSFDAKLIFKLIEQFLSSSKSNETLR